MPRRPTPTTSMHPLDLYERAVTTPDHLARFLHAVHGGNPLVLGEDFCGAAALSRGWLRLNKQHRAVVTDLDPAVLSHAGSHPRLAKRQRNVLDVKDKADIIAATNFPLFYWHTRRDLVRYLRHARSRLKKSGVFVADAYGGPRALITGRYRKRLQLPDGRTLLYTWHQESVDPLTMRVENAIHFRITGKGLAPVLHNNAFTYDWRLWSIPELRDALQDAGFKSVEVHDRLGGAIDQHGRLHTRPVSEGELDADYVAYVVARS